MRSGGVDSTPTLSGPDIHVWHAGLAATPDEIAIAAEALPAAERGKSSGGASDAHWERRVLSRARVRGILARYLSQAPSDITIRRTRRGKPAVVVRGGDLPLQFSVSHSADHMLVAVTRAGEVGVDLERLTRMPDAEGIAARFFADAEYDALLALPPHERLHAFFRAWVRKESVVKALGLGIAAAFDQFTVSLGADLQQEIDVAAITSIDGQRLWVHACDIGRPEYLAAVASPQPRSKVHVLEWT